MSPFNTPEHIRASCYFNPRLQDSGGFNTRSTIMGGAYYTGLVFYLLVSPSHVVAKFNVSQTY